MNSFVLFISVLVLSALNGNVLTAQQQEVISTGTDFVVSFAKPHNVSTELPGRTPYKINILSSENGVATITYFTSTGAQKIPAEKVVIKRDSLINIKVPLEWGVSADRTPERLGVHVQSSVPISVTTQIEFNGAGELSTHIPTAFLGKNYHVVSWPADKFYSFQSREESDTLLKITPGFALITAIEDNTVVEITPTWDIATVNDLTQSDWAAGVTKSIVLQKYQTYMFYSKATEQDVDLQRADITGTKIVSNKPVSVQSGHTKTSIIHAIDSIYSLKHKRAVGLHFIRNCIQEVVYPDEMAGKEYVVVPQRYTHLRMPIGKNIVYNNYSDSGEVVKIVAIANNTTVIKTSNNGADSEVANLQEGQYYIDSNVVQACVYRSSQPVICAQLSKSWFNMPDSVVGKAGIEKPLGPPIYEAGMPAMALLPPVGSWIEDSVVVSKVEGADCFFNIITTVLDTNLLKMEAYNYLFKQYYQISFKRIEGTNYYYAQSVPAGTVKLIPKMGLVYAVCSYYSIDGKSQGSAGATFTKVNWNYSHGKDTLSVLEDNIVESKGSIAISRGSSLNLSVQPESIFSILTTTGEIVFTSIVSQEQIAVVQTAIRGLNPGMYVLQFELKVGIQRQQLLVTP